ncbi:hypothetical protein BGX34_001216 [Mortierella sp. NVP85]|nr:hypothetical protein BGX34_001216 [Mortierella sp. NVP85]
MLAAAALVLNWQADCTYLKVFLIAFVVRKWVVSFRMMDRALYRLPLGLVEPDPDIDDERHNAVAIYMSSLFTWHGYAMLFCGSFYVFFYGASQYMTIAPVVTGVSIAFSCMGLIPFFALLVLMLGALVLLYLFYIVFICLMWPLEKCSLSRRRAISRRNGGYQSDGITNTTDIRQIEEAMVANENSGARRSGGGFRTSIVKETPAMAAIPIVIFRKRNPPQELEAVKVEIIKDTSGHQGSPVNTDKPMTKLDPVGSLDQPQCNLEGSSSMASQGSGKGLATIVHMDGADVVDDHACISTTALPHIDTPGTRSRTSSSLSGKAGENSTGDIASQDVSITPNTKPQDVPQAADSNVQTSHPSDASQEKSSIRKSAGMSAPHGKFKWKKTPDNNTLDTPAPVSHVDDFPADYPTIVDEECAICLFDFEDGDELRHLYCDHFFHRNCVDRWLSKNAFCPKCKRGI